MKNTANAMQEFKLDKKYITLTKVILVVLVTVIALSLALPFTPYAKEMPPNAVLFFTPVCTVFFCYLLVHASLILSRMPYADVAVDDNGIWYIHIGKEHGLISWESISKVRERKYIECLDLLDVNGRKLLRVEYQLHGFEDLRTVLNEKTFNNNPELKQSTFSKKNQHHWLYLIGVLGVSAGCWYIVDESPFVAYCVGGALVAGFIYEYIVTATGISIDNQNFIISYPFTNIYVPFSDVEDILLEEKFYNGHLKSEVWIISKNTKKPFKLHRIGADSNVIYKVLREAANFDDMAVL